MHHRRCVFKDNPDPNDPSFFEKLSLVIQSLDRQGLSLELLQDEESAALALHQLTWQGANEATTEVAVVRDSHHELCYASIKSRQAWFPKAAKEAFEQTLPCYQIPELIQACSRRFIEPSELVALGLLARKVDPEIIRVLAAALDHALAKTRYAAARAIAHTQWSAFSSDLEVLLKMESDPEVRKMAETALAAISRRAR